MNDFFSKIYAGCSGWVYLWTAPEKVTYAFPLTGDYARQMQERAKELSGTHQDVYFSLGITPMAMGAHERATNANIGAIGAVWADIDISNPAAHKKSNLPANVEEALSIIPTSTPPSIIVHSGHGLHVYWLLTRPVVITDNNRKAVMTALRKWQQVLRTNAQARGWTLDGTADLARIMRVPGTWNLKDEANVSLCEVIEESDVRYPFEVFTSIDVPTPEVYEDRGKGFERRKTDGPAELILQNCKFLQHCMLNAKTISYDEWVAALSNLARASDGVEACHELSRIDGDRYQVKKTNQKIEEVLTNMSPRSCQYIQNTLGFAHCEDCPVKCPSNWALAKVPKALATVRAIADIKPDTVFTEEVIGNLAVLQQEAPLEYQKFKAKAKGHVNLNDLSQTIAEHRRKTMHIVDAQAKTESTGEKTTQQLLADCPIDLRIPAGYSVDETGVREYKPRGDGTFLINQASGVPVVITARTYNLDTETEKIEVAFKYFNQWRRSWEQRSTVYSARNIIKLADAGLNVSSETAKNLVRYLQQMESINPDRIPLVYSVARIGWRNQCREFILPSKSNYRIEMDDEGDITNAMQPQGNLAQWLALATEVRGHTYARCLLAASFATPLLGLLRQRNFLLYFWGTSGGGKTAAMKAALSVWGDPNRLMTSFLTTKAGLERRLSLLSDFPVAINERQVAGSGKDKQEYLEYVVYMLEGGKGKGRASKTGLQKTASWRTIGIANGEEPLTRENSIRGVKNRIMEINTYPVLPDALAKRIHQMDSWGLAGEMFMKYLLERKPEASEIWHEMQAEFAAKYADYSSVHVDAVALILTADVLSGVWLFNLNRADAMKQAQYIAERIIEHLPRTDELSDTGRSWEYIKSWIASNKNRFDMGYGSDRLQTPIYGFKHNGQMCLFPAALRKALQDEGISYDKTLREFGTLGYIEQTDRGDGRVNNTKLIRYDGVVCRVIVLKEMLDA